MLHTFGVQVLTTTEVNGNCRRRASKRARLNIPILNDPAPSCGKATIPAQGFSFVVRRGSVAMKNQKRRIRSIILAFKICAYVYNIYMYTHTYIYMCVYIYLALSLIASRTTLRPQGRKGRNGFAVDGSFVKASMPALLRALLAPYMYIYIYEYIHTYLYVYIYTYMYTSVIFLRMFSNSTCTHISVYIYIDMNIYVPYVHIQCIYICICMAMYARIYWRAHVASRLLFRRFHFVLGFRHAVLEHLKAFGMEAQQSGLCGICEMYMYVYESICLSICMCMCTRGYIYIYIHTHTHIRVHIHIVYTGNCKNI